MTYGRVSSQRFKYTFPVGLEKMVASVKEAVAWTSSKRLNYTMGADFGMYCVAPVKGEAVTEIEALKILAGVEGRHIAPGGVGESQVQSF